MLDTSIWPPNPRVKAPLSTLNPSLRMLAHVSVGPWAQLNDDPIVNCDLNLCVSFRESSQSQNLFLYLTDKILCPWFKEKELGPIIIR